MKNPLADGVTLDRRPLPTTDADGLMLDPDQEVGLVLEVFNGYELYDDVTTYASIIVEVQPTENEDTPYYDDWLHECIFDRVTGVGRPDGDSHYEVTILETTRPDILPVGKTWSWGG